MKAIVYQRYGAPEVLHAVEVEKPAPRPHEVLVKVRATTVTIGDTRMRSFTVPQGQWLFARLFLGIFAPRRKTLGMELAGDIEAVGSEVTRFKVGDAIFASTCGVNFGGYAEYKCLPENEVMALKPANLTYEEAAAVPGAAMTALRILRKANVQPGQAVLVYGASGAVGTNAVQLAKYFGARVTAVCSTANLDLVRSLGADTVVDYTRDDFASSGATYDVVIDAAGKLPPAHGRRALKPTGIYLDVLKDSGRGEKLEDLLCVKEIIEAGRLRPVIDRCYPLEAVVEAHRYVDKGHKKGNVAIVVAHDR